MKRLAVLIVLLAAPVARAEAYVDIVSYLFKANGSPAGAAELPADRARLQQVLVTAREVR